MQGMYKMISVFQKLRGKGIIFSWLYSIIYTLANNLFLVSSIRLKYLTITCILLVFISALGQSINFYIEGP